MHRVFLNRRLFFLVILLIVSNLIITGVTILVIYNKSITLIKTSMVDLVERQKALVTVMHEEGKSDAEIIRMIKILRDKHYGIGKTGEFVIAYQKGDSVIFLFPAFGKSIHGFSKAKIKGLPINLANQGKTGFIITNDYKGEKVMAAYTYVPVLKWGIVAKIPTSEVYKPYYEAVFIAIFISILLILLSIFLFVKISNPIIKGIIENEEKFRFAVYNAPYPIMIHAEDGEVIAISQSWTDISGYTLDDIPTIEKWTERAYNTRKNEVKKVIEALYSLNERKAEGEYAIICNDGSKRVWDFSSASFGKLQDGRRAVITMAKDVTERKSQDDEREETSRLITLVNTQNDFHKRISAITDSLQGWIGSEAVGIRLKDGNDYPYYETRGFPSTFVEKEKHLCAYGPDGKILRDGTGNPVLECMCGNILCSRFDPTKPFFTAHGSFCSNNTTALLASTTEADRQARTRNLCNSEGYESVVLIPLRSENEVFGLLQFNDRHTNFFPATLISKLERIADTLAIALSRRQAMEALMRSEEKYRGLFNNIQVGMFRTKLDGSEIIDFNDHYLKIFERSREEMLGKTTLIHWADPLERDELVKILKRDGKVIDFECQMLTKQGKAKNCIASVRLYPDEEIMEGSIIDITERKKMETELRESELELLEAQRIAHIGSWAFDPVTQQTKWSDEMFHIWGLDKTLGSPEYIELKKYIRPDDWDIFNTTVKEALEKGISYNLEFNIRRPDGKERTIATLALPVYDSAGKVTGLKGTNQDITERKRIEEELRKSELNLSVAIMIAKLGSWLYDVAKDQFTFNDEFYLLFNTTAGLEGGYVMSSAQYAEKFVHPDDRPVVAVEIRKALETTDPDYYSQLDHRIVCADGELKYISVNIRIEKNKRGRTVRTYGISRILPSANKWK